MLNHLKFEFGKVMFIQNVIIFYILTNGIICTTTGNGKNESSVITEELKPPYVGEEWIHNESSNFQFQNELSYVWKQIEAQLKPDFYHRLGPVLKAWNDLKLVKPKSELRYRGSGYFKLIKTKCAQYEPILSECDVPDKIHVCSALVKREDKSVLENMNCKE